MRTHLTSGKFRPKRKHILESGTRYKVTGEHPSEAFTGTFLRHHRLSNVKQAYLVFQQDDRGETIIMDLDIYTIEPERRA